MATQLPRAQTFASLLRNSKFIQMGNPVGKVVTGRIYHVVNDDMYVDFGFKFPCVVNRPRARRASFVRGTEVKLLINSLEMSESFIGMSKDITLCEASCTLIGLADHKDTEEEPIDQS